jgi:predicted transcriptional regulator
VLVYPSTPVNPLSRRPIFPYPAKDMEVHFNPHLEARLAARATQQGCRPDEFVQDVVARFLDEEERFVEAVRRGEDALGRGEYLTHEQVGERLRRFLHP